MSDEAPPKKDEGGGAPAWVMTFADLMSLLMCFFVLLLSFSEMDLLKFKQIAGSMKSAFGVQREIKTEEAPKGTSVIAREFSPGTPSPTLLNEIRQTTIDESKQTLEFTDAVNEQEDSENVASNEQGEESGADPLQRHAKQEQISEAEEQTEMAENMQAKEEENIAEAENENKEKHEQTITDAYKLLKTLEPEIEQGLVAIKTQGNRILLRINEKGSFPSGSSIVKGTFLPVLNKIRKALSEIDGRIIVAGHTDNIPIKTARFRSNWELSSSRAVTVVHELLVLDTIPQERFVIEGHGDAHPMVPNDTSENRALNRRVELTIVQGDDEDEINEISSDQTNPFSGKIEGNSSELTSSVRDILNEEIKPPEQAEIDAIDLQTLKDQFEKIREGLKDQ
jgi:chemotaxis protein MotB